MKTKISYSLLAAAMACGLVNGQTTAYTTPVGYTTVTVVPAATTTPLSIPLERATEWAGASTAIAGDVITVAANSFVANQLVYSAGVQPKTYMAQITSGSLVGRYFKVTANGTNSLTVDSVGSLSLQGQGFLATNKITIRPYWTLSTLFPGGAPVGASGYDDPQNQVFVTYNVPNPAAGIGINRSSSVQYYFDNGADNAYPFDGTPQWADLALFAKANDVIIDPANGISIRNVSGTPLTFVVAGTVPSVPTATLTISSTGTNDHILQLPYPIGATLLQSGLAQSGAVSATTDWTDATAFDQVNVFNPSATGINPSPSKIYNYITDPAFAVDFPGSVVPGWYDEAQAFSNNIVLPAGGSVFIRKSAVSALEADTWVSPLPYNLATP